MTNVKPWNRSQRLWSPVFEEWKESDGHRSLLWVRLAPQSIQEIFCHETVKIKIRFQRWNIESLVRCRYAGKDFGQRMRKIFLPTSDCGMMTIEFADRKAWYFASCLRKSIRIFQNQGLFLSGDVYGCP